MKQEPEIIDQVYKAKGDLDAADQLVRQYLPFIKSETAKFIHRAPEEGYDDELSIAMFAFHESVLNYSKAKGTFLSFASMNIKNRLIDYYRKEKRHSDLISLDRETDDGEHKQTVLEKLDSGKDEIGDRTIRQATKEEILEFSAQLSDYGLTLGDIAMNCPKQDRTLSACHRALAYAKEHPELLKALISEKKLPIARLVSGSGVERKTLERHRKYMVAILLAYTNGFEIIRGHLCQIAPREGGKNI